MKQGDLQKILDSGLESQFIVQYGATFTSLTASFGFGRMNLPFRIMKVNAAKDAFEDVDVNTLYYAVPEKVGYLVPKFCMTATHQIQRICNILAATSMRILCIDPLHLLPNFINLAKI